MNALQQMFVFAGAALCAGCVTGVDQREELDTGGPTEIIDPCRSLTDYEFEPVEDFELGIGRTFWVSSDGTGEMVPIPGREPEASAIDGGRCGISAMALRMTARDMAIYGGAFGISFYPDGRDVSAFDGISFWVKTAPGVGNTLMLSVSEQHTDEYNGGRIRDGEPFCLENTTDESEKCDRFSAGVGMGTEWRFVAVPFSAMQQRGYGKPAPFLDTAPLLGFQLGFETGDWDFWIDDIAFYRER